MTNITNRCIIFPEHNVIYFVIIKANKTTRRIGLKHKVRLPLKALLVSLGFAISAFNLPVFSEPVPIYDSATTDKININAVSGPVSRSDEYLPDMWYSGNGDALADPFSGYGLGPVWGHIGFFGENGSLVISNSSSEPVSPVIRYSVGTDNRGGKGGISVSPDSLLNISGSSDVPFSIVIPFICQNCSEKGYIALSQSENGDIAAVRASKEAAYSSEYAIRPGSYSASVPLFSAVTENTCGACGSAGIYSIDFIPHTGSGTVFRTKFSRLSVNTSRRIILGDLDCDYDITIKDLIKMKKHLAGHKTSFSFNAADINRDFEINASDMAELTEFLLTSYAPSVMRDTYSEDMILGINGHHKGYSSYPESALESQISLAAETGAKIYRFNFTPDLNNQADTEYLDRVAFLCEKYNMELFLIIYDWKFNPLDPSIEYNSLFSYGKTLASRYADRITYFQISNEQDVKCLLPVPSVGESPSDYDTQYTLKVAEYMKALSEGIKSGNRFARTSVNISFRHTYFLNILIESGVKWDITGIDWYSNMGDPTPAMNNLLSLPVNDIFVSEINTWGGNADYTDAEQMNYFTEMKNYFQRYDRVKAFIVYELLDEPTLQEVEKSFGLVECDGNGNAGDKKPVYGHIKQLFGN